MSRTKCALYYRRSVSILQDGPSLRNAEGEEMIAYGFSKHVDTPFAKVVEEVTARLKEQGFGVLTTIDVREKFKEKLGIDFKKYVILGACHPANAHKAILAEEDIGLLLPCNVIVYEKDGGTTVSVIRPTVAMQMIGNPALQRIAEDVEAKLENVLASIGRKDRQEDRTISVP